MLTDQIMPNDSQYLSWNVQKYLFMKEKKQENLSRANIIKEMNRVEMF